MQHQHNFWPLSRFLYKAASTMAWVMLVLPTSASATLGENSASTQSDRASMNGSLQLVPAANYTVHEIRTATGTTLREYVAPAGVVFAVAWQGPVMPDLRQALGRYFDRYIAAAAGQQAGHRQTILNEADIVVQSNGQMRSFSGRAYLPQMLPGGVTPADIR